MRILSLSFTLATALLITTPAFANSRTVAVNGAGGSQVNFNTVSNSGSIGPGSLYLHEATGPSETAWFFHRRGVKQYEANNLDKAEKAFEASLRAQGKSLKGQTLVYLANIAKEKGQIEKANSYARDYLDLQQTQQER